MKTKRTLTLRVSPKEIDIASDAVTSYHERCAALVFGIVNTGNPTDALLSHYIHLLDVKKIMIDSSLLNKTRRPR